jgi:sterol desaturase/sphingolipid hydroxylase (fatty acid hydroxylase superfamily)
MMTAVILALLGTFSFQSATALIINGVPNVQIGTRHVSCAKPHAFTIGWANHRGLCSSVARCPAPLASVETQEGLDRPSLTPSHLTPGPIMLAWTSALATMSLQVLFTDWTQLESDAAYICQAAYDSLPSALDPLGVLGAVQTDPNAQKLALFAFLYINSVGFSFIMPALFRPEQTEAAADGSKEDMVVPYRSSPEKMPQHAMTAVDWSYVALNSMCMPGLFFHFITICRGWGLDFGAPPLFGIYPPGLRLLSETVPELLLYVPFYFVLYEFVYYWWHRAMHEVPALYKWVHKHHHQQTYPDRAALDTLNTGCLESQVGLYAQLGMLWGVDKLTGVHSLPGAIWFFTIAGWLSVLEHDRFQRCMPFELFRADDHHMHHAFVKCNYSPYSVIWDKVFGTFKPFKVMKKKEPVGSPDLSASPELVLQAVPGAVETMTATMTNSTGGTTR